MAPLDDNPGPRRIRHAAPPPAAATSTRCLKCGYDLQGLFTTGACPECGTPIRDPWLLCNIRSRSLFFFLRRARAAEFAAILCAAAALFTSPHFQRGTADQAYAALVMLDTLASYALAISLYHLATRRKGTRPHRRPPPRLLMALLITTLAFRIPILLANAFPGMHTVQVIPRFRTPPALLSGSPTAGQATDLGLTMFFALLALNAVTSFAFARLLMIVASRLPDPPLQRRAHQLCWVAPICHTLGYFLGGAWFAWLIYAVSCRAIHRKISDLLRTVVTRPT